MKAIALIFCTLVLFACTTTQEQNTQQVVAPAKTEPPKVENSEPVVDVAEPTVPDTTEPPVKQPPIVEPTPAEQEGVSLAELATHNTQSDCWVAYKGKVYDVTSYLPVHPGGAQAIGKWCGTSDGFEQAFTKKHGTSKVSLLEKEGEYKGDLL